MKRIRNPKREPLKACPFDGGPARLIATGPAHLPNAVECMTCHARTTWYRLQNVAVLNWNRRAA